MEFFSSVTSPLFSNVLNRFLWKSCNGYINWKLQCPSETSIVWMEIYRRCPWTAGYQNDRWTAEGQLKTLFCGLDTIVREVKVHLFASRISFKGVKLAVCGPRGTHPADVCVPLKSGKCHLSLPRPMHACPCHDTWKRLWTAGSCKGETSSRRDNWYKPVKGDNPDRKS
jgi:hypothetical protein